VLILQNILTPKLSWEGFAEFFSSKTFLGRFCRIFWLQNFLGKVLQNFLAPKLSWGGFAKIFAARLSGALIAKIFAARLSDTLTAKIFGSKTLLGRYFKNIWLQNFLGTIFQKYLAPKLFLGII
jgi:hypothetical protein